MDHVLSKEELEEFHHHIPEIPWLGYDHRPSELGDFDDYALQRGWSRERLFHLKEGRLGDLEKEGLKAFLQSWFSIGLYEMALSRSLDKDGFIVQRDSSLFFSSEPLRQLFKDLREEFQNLPRDDPHKIQMLEHLVRVLTSASVWSRMLGEPQLFINVNADFCDDTYESIMRLFTLSGVAVQYMGEVLANFVQGSFRGRLQSPWIPIDAYQRALAERLVKRGWCPYVKTMLSPVNIIVAEYAAIVGPPATRFTHNSCSADGCVRHNIDESTYKPRHIRSGCQCPFVRPSLPRIAEVLDSGRIPLMDFNSISEAEDGMTVEVVPMEDASMFSAVSHVWSGGLGSTSEEGLPACAVDFLASYAEVAGPSKLTWIDSLCIPREKRLRKMSITGMNKVYTRASRTLVLDPELLHAATANTRRLLLWVTTAAWMQRMWTLPEGRLSQVPLFAFNDGVVLLSDLMKDANRNDSDNPVSGSLMPDLLGLFSANINPLRYIHQSLCYRTTSKREDEVPALAGLFDIDARRILETKSLEDRMAMFWIALREKVRIPMNILFLGGEKLPIAGLRWAPRSLLNAGRQLSLLGPPSGVTTYDVELSDSGTLTATYVVIRLQRRSKLLLNKFNPIKLAFNPDPGSREVPVGLFTILVMPKTRTDTEDAGILEDIDAFAVNVTNLEARAGRALANELLSSVKTVIALTMESSPPRPFEEESGANLGRPKDEPSSYARTHSFIARYRMQLSPIETLGDELITGFVGWARISIS
ncbi:hypothetical protein G647_07821 [Cladophialophora carrionii CBS 160.54]|uniref:Heterokaryon incompatibility domain-containing protein n=1 Tax=Cladophialophora carrionii CBS 160.54 TaxID=1279043 RepID=V9D3K2_9EURO|nr:uncharacterized protein G647_07821 [Cladophialophora carrionii CBS 160.54]ETI21474.1 hypothetical protein G647_07821 [Cladophialophora carrionii CBS 160.54]